MECNFCEFPRIVSAVVFLTLFLFLVCSKTKSHEAHESWICHPPHEQVSSRSCKNRYNCTRSWRRTKKRKKKPKQLHLVRWKPCFFFWAIRRGGFLSDFMSPEILKHWFEYFCPKTVAPFVSLQSWDICQISTMRKYWACLIPLLQVVLSDMFMHVTTKFLWHCWTQGIFVGDWNCKFGMSLLFANETATLHDVIMSFWISKHRWFGPCWDVIPQKLPPTVGFDSGYVNTASNLEILAQLVPFLISWPNEGVQQMMLG